MANLITDILKTKYSEVITKEVSQFNQTDFHDKVDHLFGTENYTLADDCKEVPILQSLEMIRHQLKFVLARVMK